MQMNKIKDLCNTINDKIVKTDANNENSKSNNEKLNIDLEILKNKINILSREKETKIG